jgi:hypothetical protein
MSLDEVGADLVSQRVVIDRSLWDKAVEKGVSTGRGPNDLLNQAPRLGLEFVAADSELEAVRTYLVTVKREVGKVKEARDLVRQAREKGRETEFESVWRRGSEIVRRHNIAKL